MYKVRFILKPGMSKDSQINMPAAIYGHSDEEETVLQLTFESQEAYENQLADHQEGYRALMVWHTQEGLYTFPESSLYIAYSIEESDE